MWLEVVFTTSTPWVGVSPLPCWVLEVEVLLICGKWFSPLCKAFGRPDLCVWMSGLEPRHTLGGCEGPAGMFQANRTVVLLDSALRSA